jgi:hypothetical protein
LWRVNECYGDIASIDAAAFRQIIAVLQFPSLEDRHPVPLFVASVEARQMKLLEMSPLNFAEIWSIGANFDLAIVMG